MLGCSESGSTSEPFQSTPTHSSDNISDVVRSELPSDSDQPASPLADEDYSDRHSDAQSQSSQGSLRCDEDISTSQRSSQNDDSGLGDSSSEEHQHSNMPPCEEDVWKEALESLFPGSALCVTCHIFFLLGTSQDHRSPRRTFCWPLQNCDADMRAHSSVLKRYYSSSRSCCR